LVRRTFPDRFFEFGISEQDMVSAAGGMALHGLIPVVNSFAAFLCRRANEQIYNNSCEGTTVIYVGHLAGLLPAGPGPSHECLDVITLMKTIPGMLVLEPQNFIQIRQAIWYAARMRKGPAYIRIPCLKQVEGMRR
jgi:transketolase